MKRRPEGLAVVLDQLGDARRHCEVLACISADPATGQVFARLATAKAELVQQIAAQLGVVIDPTVPTASRCRRSDRLYRRWWPAAGRAPVTGGDVAALVAAEDRLLHRCEQWLAGKPAPALRLALKRYLPQVSACHADLRRLCGEGANPRQKAGSRPTARMTAPPAWRVGSGSTTPNPSSSR